MKSQGRGLAGRASCLAFAVAAGFASSCTTVETVPEVRVLPNESGLSVDEMKALGPSYLIGGVRESDGQLSPPDVPSRVVMRVRRVQPLSNNEPRYFIAASGFLQVVSVERYSDYYLGAPRGESPLERWRELLDLPDPSGGEVQERLRERKLPEIPWMNAARVFHAKVRKRDFPWGRAVMFLTTYVQGNTGGPVNNDMLVLVVQGLTKDGRYGVKGHFEIRHPKLPDLDWKKSDEGRRVYFSIDDEGEQAEQWLDGQDDLEFSPTFAQYEELLGALEIRPGEPFEVGAMEKR